MNKKILLLDFDDTMINNNWHRHINRFLGTNFSRDEVKSYRVDKYITDTEKRLEFANYIQTVDFYEDATQMADAYDVVKKLYDKYDVYICTSAILNIGNGLKYVHSLSQKFDALQKFYPFISPEKLIFTQSKHLVKGDIIIDDSLYNFSGNQTQKIMFGCFMNNELTDGALKDLNITRLYSWKEIEKLLI